MAVTALHTASTGLSALSQQIDIIANNLANVNTTGYKSFRANLEDLIYQQKAQPGVETENGQCPAGLFVGLGTRVSNTQPDFTQGSTISTGQQYDLLIQGSGFFRVKIPQQINDQIGYTRDGNFFPNANGQLVLGNSAGPLLDPPITIPTGTTSVTIAQDGTVNAYTSTSPTPNKIGQLQLANFLNPAGLTPIGTNVYVASAASGTPIEGTAAQGDFGTIQQGALEASNVDSVTELVNLIKTQRAFEMNSQSIQCANQMLQVIGNLRNA
jgi:flagellar basal-body rod protein FlgG